MRIVIGLGSVTLFFIIGYWSALFAGAFAVADLVPGYRHWFMAFPVADAWIGLWAGLAAVAAWRRRESARRYALIAGSGLVFLGIYAMTYGITTGLICRQTVDEYIEIAIKIYCLGAGGFLTAWGLICGRRSSLGGCRSHACSRQEAET